MPISATRSLADWSSALTFEDLPDDVVRRVKLQLISVLAATSAGMSGSKLAKFKSALERGEPAEGDCRVIGGGGRAGLGTALTLNAAASVVHDFDDYLFAGHTGHSAVLGSIAVAELLRAEGSPTTGRDLIAAIAAANEAGGRLGASMLFGPHNGQMWSYIHLLGGAVAGAKLLRLDGDGTESAIGMAFSQPNNPMVASFMGSDAKALIAAEPTIAGVRGSFYAAEGLTGAGAILEDRGGFWARFHPDAMAKFFSGFSDAWLTESLSYKIYPGCAYIDTAIDALLALLGRFESEHDRAVAADDIDSITVEAGFLTCGMETMSGWYRGEHISPMNVNFSVALSGAVTILAGQLTPAEFEPSFYLEREGEILEIARRFRIDNTGEMNAAMASGPGNFDLREVLASSDNALDGADFSKYESRFPAQIKVAYTDGRSDEERCDIPLGGAGRPLGETDELVSAKLRSCLSGESSGSWYDESNAARILDAIGSLEDSPDAVSDIFGDH